MTRQATMTTLNCKQIQAMLDEADWQAVMPVTVVKHCQQCSNCQNYQKQLTALRGLLVAPAQIKAPGDFDIKLRQRIAARQKTVDWGWRPFLWQSAIGTTAAMLLIFGVLISKDWYQMRNTATPTNVAMEQPVSSTVVDPAPVSTTPANPTVATRLAPPSEKAVNTLPPPIRVTTRSLASPAASGRRQLEVVEPTIIYGAQPMVEAATEEEDVATIF
jgi:hypothetical protein